MKRKNALVLCRTPLQSKIVKAILISEMIDEYDLFYFTQNDSEEDIHYYKILASGARFSQYLHINNKIFDLLNHIFTYLSANNIFKKSAYDIILISSFDSLAFRKIITINKLARILTYDDGAAYIDISMNSFYLHNQEKLRDKLYRLIFNIISVRAFLDRVSCHFSIYRNFQNIMSQRMVRYVDIFADYEYSGKDRGDLIFFIGESIDQDTDFLFNEKVIEYLRSHPIDFYVKHPREISPLVDFIPVLRKNGRIAEEAILVASQGKRPILVGGFTSVFFNMSSTHIKKIMLLSINNSKHLNYANLGRKAGCTIEFI